MATFSEELFVIQDDERKTVTLFINEARWFLKSLRKPKRIEVTIEIGEPENGETPGSKQQLRRIMRKNVVNPVSEFELFFDAIPHSHHECWIYIEAYGIDAFLKAINDRVEALKRLPEPPKRRHA